MKYDTHENRKAMGLKKQITNLIYPHESHLRKSMNNQNFSIQIQKGERVTRKKRERLVHIKVRGGRRGVLGARGFSFFSSEAQVLQVPD